MTPARRVNVRTTPARTTPARTTALPSPHAPAPVPTPFGTGVTTACAGEDPDLFFDEEDPAPAQAICRRCPARAACLAYAILNEEFGVWGGTTPQERAALRNLVPIVTPEERQAAADIWARVNAGAQVDELAREYQVSSRTVARWLADGRSGGSREGSPDRAA